MIRSLWIAKTGLDAQQTQMDVISNNLANVSTSGFKRARAVIEDLLYQTIRQPGAQSSEQTQLEKAIALDRHVLGVAGLLQIPLREDALGGHRFHAGADLQAGR